MTNKTAQEARDFINLIVKDGFDQFGNGNKIKLIDLLALANTLLTNSADEIERLQSVCEVYAKIINKLAPKLGEPK